MLYYFLGRATRGDWPLIKKFPVTLDSDSTRFARALKSAILLPAGVILLTAIVLLLFICWLLQAIKLSEHSYQVLARTRTCEINMINMETGVRGYLLNGETLFLDPYKQGLAEIDDDFKQLKELVQDNPGQSERVDDLIQAKDHWIDYAKSSIRQRQQGPVPAVDWNKMGKNLMDDLRAKFERFTEVELQLRTERLDHVRQVERALGYAGGGLLVLLCLSVAYFVRRQFMALAGDYRAALSTIEERHAALVRSEADLEAQKEWFRVTLASIGDGVIVTDQEGRVVFLNHEAEELTGWNSIDALLKPLAEVFYIVNEDTRSRVENPVARVLREKKVVGLANHTILISRLGPEYPVEDSAAPINDSQGKVLGVVLVFHNATDVRRTQNTLKIHTENLEKKVHERTIQLQQTVTELEAFSYTVSHDLRSPLRAMQGFSQAVLEDYGHKLDQQGKDYLTRIQNASERLDRLIQDLLSYTRLSRQTDPLTAQDLDRIVREVIEHDPELHPPAVNIEVEGALPRVLGREAPLTQIVSNLLGNAVKFVTGGTPPKIRIWAEEQGSRVRLWVEDNGIGIAARDHERIFQMFVQVHEARIYSGTGIGLAIVKRAAQNMQGEVGLESDEGKGSKFWVELNRAAA
jgi:PAS domain S-box-containing protein